MKCVYINLDSQTARRAAMEAHFAAAAPADWELVRTPALGPADVAHIAGSCGDAEKACFMSHRLAILGALGDDEPILILEDDTRVSPRTFAIIDRLLASDLSWDLIYTEFQPVRAATMVSMAKRWRRLVRRDDFQLLDLSSESYGGALGYLLAGPAKAKLIHALNPVTRIDQPFDLVLRMLAHTGRLAAKGLLPFITRQDETSQISTIQPDSAKTRDAVLGAYRRLLYIDRDDEIPAVRAQLAALQDQAADEGAELVGAALGLMVSDLFPDKW